MYDAMIAVADVVHPASMGVEPSRALDGIGILHTFRAADGWFTVEVVREPHFAPFARAVGHPEWVEDPRLADRSGWSRHMDDVIRPGVEAWARGRTKLGAATELAAAGVAAGPVNHAADIVADPHVVARGFVHTLPTPDGSGDGRVAVVGNPIAFRTGDDDHGDDGASAPVRPWPTLGADTDRILAERLGLGDDERRDLRARGVIA
jgi:CoA:oxalate CoA-transferase